MKPQTLIKPAILLICDWITCYIVPFIYEWIPNRGQTLGDFILQDLILEPDLALAVPALYPLISLILIALVGILAKKITNLSTKSIIVTQLIFALISVVSLIYVYFTVNIS